MQCFWQMERNAAAGRTFGSIPIATPPPVSSPTVAYNKSATSFQHRGRVQGVESGSHAFEDNSSSTYSDTRSPEYAESLPLKSSAGHNVMANPQGKALIPFRNRSFLAGALFLIFDMALV